MVHSWGQMVIMGFLGRSIPLILLRFAIGTLLQGSDSRGPSLMAEFRLPMRRLSRLKHGSSDHKQRQLSFR